MARHKAFVFITVSLISSAQNPTRSVTDPGTVTTRQSITPAGVPAVFQGKVYGVSFGADPSEVWVLTATRIYQMDWRSNKIISQVPLEGTAGLQGIVFDPVGGRALSSGADGKRKTRLLAVRQGQKSILSEGAGSQISGGLAVAPGKTAVVPLIYDNKVAVVDLAGGASKTASTDIAPFAAAVNRAGTVAWVTNWGGRKPSAKDLTAPTGLAPEADRVVVDTRGVTASGTVVRLDLAGQAEPVRIATGLHPTGLAWDEERGLLYVANANSESISVVDTKASRLVRTISVQPFDRRVTGIAPIAIVVSKDGSRLWAACGGINAVAQIATASGRIEGLIPTAWYPNALSLSPDGRQLAVSTLLGAGSAWRDEPRQRFVHAYRGSVHIIDLPDTAQLASFTAAVAENNHMRLAGAAPQSPPPAATNPIPIPARAGDPTPIEHVVYVVKENRTYDQVFGDMGKGNGDPSLVMFGEKVTPNHRHLADQFVLLDNLYATGGNSADGHQWVTQANETSYTMWPGYAGRSYPFDGTDPIAYSSGGFIWDLAIARKKSVRVFGQFIPRFSEARASDRIRLLKEWEQGGDFSTRYSATAHIATLTPLLAKNYPGYSNAIPDLVRASILKKEIAEWEAKGSMPNLTIIQLPCDHTFGTSPGTSTPAAMVADNDFALGQIVEALTHTRFWRKMAIFVVEDDAQNGVDHVDGHRTVALAISPYTKRNSVDSTFYSHQSILKTIELILGLPTLSLFDLIANDMRASFTSEPDFRPYSAVAPRQSLYDLNPSRAELRGPALRAAIDSAKMRWEVPDAVPSDKLNKILWHATRGWNTPYPGIRRAVFAPLAVDLEDEEQEERAGRGLTR
jgi:DNA-binding beta-propeller fold protein YncE